MKSFLIASALWACLCGMASAQQALPVVLVASNPADPGLAQSTTRQGQVLADILKDRDITGVAVTYVSDGYGKALETAFVEAFQAHGGRIAISLSHSNNQENYFNEVGALSVAGVEHLVVFGYLDQGGLGIVQTALDTGAFEKFVLGDSMIGEQLIQSVGADLDGTLGTLPDYAAPDQMETATTGETATPQETSGEILPGEIARAVDIEESPPAAGETGSADMPLVALGPGNGTFREIEIRNGRFETIKIR